MSALPNKANPVAVAAANGALGAISETTRRRPYTPNRVRASLLVRLAPDADPVAFRGREAQTLKLLIDTAPRGFTSGEASPLAWARRTSAYIHDLRGAGVPIATTRERTPDGAVARDSLSGQVTVVNDWTTAANDETE